MEMPLSQLLVGVPVTKLYQTMYGRMVVTHETIIRNVQYDSRKVGLSDMFVAIRGVATDGNNFVSGAIASGAKAVLTDNDGAMPDTYFMHAGVIKVLVPDARAALAVIAANSYRHPAKDLAMVGVTGTNGKTTTTHIIKTILEASGKRTGLLGTVGNMIGETMLEASHTTPESLELHGLLRRMTDAGCKSAVMEVSSHALDQHRVDGIGFAVAVFTNLTQDHLDYHHTMEEYYAAKRLLFTREPRPAHSVINTDDAFGARLFDEVTGDKISYGINEKANVRATNIALSLTGSKFTATHAGRKWEIASPLVGRFNVHNLLAGFASGIALGIDGDTLAGICSSVVPPPGRFEQITSSKGWTAIVDYAHTPDALEKALNTIHDVRTDGQAGKIVTVFGCGGNRDKKKRPIMGEIAARLSDEVIVTSDNPRTEDAEMIIADVLVGIGRTEGISREPDRAKAIVKALDRAETGDVILVAGKGHEDYQIVGDRKLHFSDRELITDYVRTAE